MSAKKYQVLTDEDVEHFMEKGYVVLHNCFTQEQADANMRDMWIRLNRDPNDKSTWTPSRVHLPTLRTYPVKEFSPKAWGAICDLLGGEERINSGAAVWNDAFILNFGTPEEEGKIVHPKDLTQWHADGDFFLHFLDSPEQALLVTPVWTKIVKNGGGTFIAPGSIEPIARWLDAHPEGVTPGLGNEGTKFHFLERLQEAGDEFVELTGDVGDVVLMHPLMMHSVSKNARRDLRVITNPPVSVKEPFNFNRENPDDLSLVELKTLKSIGKEKYDYKPGAPRRLIVPPRVAIQEKLKQEELARLREHALKNNLPLPAIVAN